MCVREKDSERKREKEKRKNGKRGSLRERERERERERFIYSVFTKDTLDEKGQARDTRVHVTL